ncbi:hypothetical protein BDW22DRAFT_1362130 [Trametopsis cervina]|nr:hypothetical protein BDW22DRAFT_1362130 [Trametopsis cervina]
MTRFHETTTAIRRTLHSMYSRVTLSGVTLSFFLLSLAFFAVQLLIQAILWNSDATAFSRLDGIMQHADVPSAPLRWLTSEGDNYDLKMCSRAPNAVKNASEVCATIFNTMYPAKPDWAAPSAFRITNASKSLSVHLEHENTTIQLTEQCAYTLLYPTQRLRNSVDEELALIFAQVWLLAISSSAVFFQSVPHLLALFAMRVLSTGWSAYTIWRTMDLRIRVDRLIMGANTPCHSDFDIFPTYFSNRIAFQIPDLVLSVCALLYTAVLGWLLLRTFNAGVFNCVGPPARIVRLYRYMLTVHVSGQLLIYLTISSLSLALRGVISHKSKHLPMYLTLYIFIVLVTLAMVPLGYCATRFERRRSMAIFLVVTLGYIVGFLAVFAYPDFVFSWLQWPFYACLTGINAAALIVCAIFAVICRVHFREGLSHYLHVERVLSNDSFATDDFFNRDTVQDIHFVRTSYGENQTVNVRSKQDVDWDAIDQVRPAIFNIELSSYSSSSSSHK